MNKTEIQIIEANIKAQLEEDLQILKTLLNELGYKDIPIDYEYFRKTQKVLKKDNNEKV